MDAQTEFSTGIRARFQNEGDMKGRAGKIIQFLGGLDGKLKPELDKRLDPNLVLPDSKARAERLAAVITSGRASNLARRFGLREGGTLAFDLFDEGGTEPKVGEGRRGMLLGMEPDGDLVVADLAVELLGADTDWTARAIQFRLSPLSSAIDPDLLSRKRMRIRVLDMSAFYDRYARRSSFTGKPKWYVGQERLVNRNPLDDSAPRPFAPDPCPNCHRLTQPRPKFQFDPPTTPLEDSPRGSSTQTCATCHQGSLPGAVKPLQFRQFGNQTPYGTQLSEAQRKVLLEWIEASQGPTTKSQ
jgi:hypothetical protein